MINSEEVKQKINKSLAFKKAIAEQSSDASDNSAELSYKFFENAVIEVDEWIDSLKMLIDLTKVGTGGSRVAAQFLCNIYNANRVKFNPRELHNLSFNYWNDAMNVLKLDRLNYVEIHKYIENGRDVFEEMIVKYGTNEENE